MKSDVLAEVEYGGTSTQENLDGRDIGTETIGGAPEFGWPRRAGGAKVERQ
jgi:hypothetical protein